ncbi:hypothetical protein M408DRAFT_30501, partial [Serendipita vermifera MAFF 305830]
MFPMTDIYYPTTRDDIIRVKQSIHALQSEFDSAMALIAQTQLRVEEIKKEIELKEASIAPIKLLTFDALSTIFEVSGEVEWSSPLQISGVCRFWRQVVLATPRAWSFVQLQSGTPLKIANLFFDRSGQCPLHINFPKELPYRILSPIAHRIRCLTVQDFPPDTRDLVFTNLHRVAITHSRHPIPVSFFNCHRFPTLKYLRSNMAVTKDEPSRGTEDAPPPPPLKGWSLWLMQNEAWMGCLHRVQDTLVSLKLLLNSDNHIEQRHSISLPALKSLEIKGYRIY